MVKFATLEHLLTQFSERDKKFNSANLLKRRQTVSLHSRLLVYTTSVHDSLSRGFADVTFSDFFLGNFALCDKKHILCSASLDLEISFQVDQCPIGDLYCAR